MTAKSRSTSRSLRLPRLTSARLWAAYAASLAILALGAASSFPKHVRSAVEGLVLGLAVAALLVHPSIASILRSTSRRARYGASCLVLTFVIAHVAKVTAYTFPFVDWRMFGRSSQGQPEGLRFTAIRADGSSERIALGASISDATVSRLDGMIRKQLESTARDQLTQLIDAAVELESLDSRKSPIESVLISECIAPMEEPETTRCSPLETVHVAGSRGRF